jgi:hypothetical protein
MDGIELNYGWGNRRMKSYNYTKCCDDGIYRRVVKGGRKRRRGQGG